MAHIIADRVREVSTTSGTTDFALSGAVTNFQAFSAVMANGDTCWYAATLEAGGWEVGLGTWVTGGTLQRTTILASSTGSKVSFGAGAKDIFMVVPAGGVLTSDALDTLIADMIGDTIQPYDADTAKTDVAQNFTAPQRTAPVALTSGTTITMDLADGNDRTLTLAHNATISNPSDIASYVGQKGSIAGQQDGTGGRTLSMGNQWYPVGGATMPAIPSGANNKWRIDYHVVSSTRIDFTVSSVGV
jgi:hypothetical protein